MKRCERTVGTAWVVGMSLCLAACEVSGPGTPGELGGGEYSFTYQCINRNMVSCVDAHVGPEVPGGIVVGGWFGLRLHWESARIEPAAPSMVETENGGFVARLPGTVAMLGIATEDGRVLDLVHLNFVDLHEFRLEGLGADGVTLAVGEQRQLDARPLSESGAVLAGTLDCEWHSSDKSIVIPVQSSGVCSNDIRGMNPGTATITMSAGDVLKSVDVTVK